MKIDVILRVVLLVSVAGVSAIYLSGAASSFAMSFAVGSVVMSVAYTITSHRESLMRANPVSRGATLSPVFGRLRRIFTVQMMLILLLFFVTVFVLEILLNSLEASKYGGMILACAAGLAATEPSPNAAPKGESGNQRDLEQSNVTID